MVFQERKSRDTGLKRMVDTSGASYKEHFEEFITRRGFTNVKSYVRAARSTAKSAPKVIGNEPTKTAAFMSYFSKFCPGRSPKNIDYRIGKAIKKMGAGAKNTRLIKVATEILYEDVKHPLSPKALSQQFGIGAVAGATLGAIKGGVGRAFGTKGFRRKVVEGAAVGGTTASLIGASSRLQKQRVNSLLENKRITKANLVKQLNEKAKNRELVAPITLLHKIKVN